MKRSPKTGTSIRKRKERGGPPSPKRETAGEPQGTYIEDWYTE